MEAEEEPGRRRLAAANLSSVRLHALTQLWAVAHLLDAAEAADLAGWRVVVRLVVALLAIDALWRPSQTTLVRLAAAQVLGFVLLAPPTSNHPLLLVAVNSAILIAVILPPAGSICGRWEAFGRLALLVGYWAAAISKLNDGFFQGAVSCANFIAHDVTFGLIESAGVILPWLVAGTELAIAALLLVPRTRTLGVRVGVTFHVVVSLSPVAGVRDFTATLLALFAAFLPETALLQARDAVGRWLRRTPVLRALGDRWFITLLTIVGLLAGGWIPFLVAWLPFTVLAVLIVFAVWKTPMGSERQSTERLLTPQLPVLVLLAVIAAGPYLGLGTAPAFTPFSNLRTEGPGTNHLFIPSVHIVDHQNDVVWVTDVTSPSADGSIIEDGGRGLTYSSLRVFGDDDPMLRVSGIDTVTGELVRDRLASAYGSPTFAERYLLSFRFVPSATDPACSA